MRKHSMLPSPLFVLVSTQSEFLNQKSFVKATPWWSTFLEFKINNEP